MRRRTCDDPVQVRISGDRLVGFRRGGCEYEVLALVKLLAYIRPMEEVNRRLCQVRARSASTPEATYELQCDHGRWRLVAVWD